MQALQPQLDMLGVVDKMCVEFFTTIFLLLYTRRHNPSIKLYLILLCFL